jgi:hypothetical protein
MFLVCTFCCVGALLLSAFSHTAFSDSTFCMCTISDSVKISHISIEINFEKTVRMPFASYFYVRYPLKNFNLELKTFCSSFQIRPSNNKKTIQMNFLK